MHHALLDLSEVKREGGEEMMMMTRIWLDGESETEKVEQDKTERSGKGKGGMKIFHTQGRGEWEREGLGGVGGEWVFIEQLETRTGKGKRMSR